MFFPNRKWRHADIAARALEALGVDHIFKFWKGDLDFIFMLDWHVLPISNHFQVIRFFHFYCHFRTGSEHCVVGGITKNPFLEYISLLASFALLCTTIGSRVGLCAWQRDTKTRKLAKFTKWKVAGPAFVTTKWSCSRWSDLNQIWQDWWTWECNHPRQIWSQSIYNFIYNFDKGLRFNVLGHYVFVTAKSYRAACDVDTPNELTEVQNYTDNNNKTTINVRD